LEVDWLSLPFSKQMSLVLRAHNEPTFFVEDKHFLGERMFPMQKEIMNEFYKGKYQQLVVIAGMRSGKTRLGVFFLLYELFKLLCLDNAVQHYNLAKGEKIYLLAVSYKEDQAYDTILTPLKSELDNSPFFKQFRYRLVENEIRFDNFTIRVFGANSLGNVGRTAKAVMFDELARYKYEQVSVSVPAHDYILAGDPSVRNNAFGFALIHEENEKIIVDGLFRYLPTKRLEVDPVEIENFITRVVDTVPVRTVVFDTWHYPTILGKLASRGIEIISHIVRKPDYDVLKAKLYENKLEICNFPDIIDELRSLEVEGTKITTSQTKDVADALANAIYVNENFKSKKYVSFNLARRL